MIALSEAELLEYTRERMTHKQALKWTLAHVGPLAARQSKNYQLSKYGGKANGKLTTKNIHVMHLAVQAAALTSKGIALDWVQLATDMLEAEPSSSLLSPTTAHNMELARQIPHARPFVDLLESLHVKHNLLLRQQEANSRYTVDSHQRLGSGLAGLGVGQGVVMQQQQAILKKWGGRYATLAEYQQGNSCGLPAENMARGNPKKRAIE
ncbi:hypothetical protein WJX72_000812 [[Myrmecia] bisecta]|uniref:Uncharacterized protein n=1 Tax=[Myrmecia] bisecta TaxID=41462 RepID=A0AAW1QNT5_9CHLO